MVTVICNTINSKFINNDDTISQKVKNIYSHLENTDNENHATSDNMSLKDKLSPDPGGKKQNKCRNWYLLYVPINCEFILEKIKIK